MWIKKKGRRSMPDNKKVVKKNTSYSPINYEYILEIINSRKWKVGGNYSRVVNEIISNNRVVKRYKQVEADKLKEKLSKLEN